MDSTGGETAHAVREADEKVEEHMGQQVVEKDEKSGAEMFDVPSEKTIEAEKEYNIAHSSGDASSQTSNEKPDPVIDVKNVKDENDVFAHLPDDEAKVLKKQLDIPPVNVNYRTLYRYASVWDMTIVAVAALCAVTAGAVLPLMTACDQQFEKSLTTLLIVSRSSSANSRAFFKVSSTVQSPMTNSTTILATLLCTSYIWRLENSRQPTLLRLASSTRESTSRARFGSNTWQPFCVRTLHSSMSWALERLLPASPQTPISCKMASLKRSV